jgi:large subunit ribosomal protein L17
MRHAKKGRKLGTDASHRKAMLRSLAASLLQNERIKTTEAKAKEVRSLTERIITWGKRGDVHARRLALAELGDRDLTHKVFDDIAERFDEREGGYTRILKLGPRKGDGAPMVIIELVE